jgi:hypothetical protein
MNFSAADTGTPEFQSREVLSVLIRDFTECTKITYTEAEDGFELSIPLPGDRKQKVFITADRRDSDGEELFQIFTICAEANPALYAFALKLNMEIDYGALAIKEIYGKDHLVIVDTQLVRTAQPVEIEKSVITLAEVGDDIEQILTGEDLR